VDSLPNLVASYKKPKEHIQLNPKAKKCYASRKLRDKKPI
jgi:hypothetical protein